MEYLDDETIEQINQFWLDHQDDPHLQNSLYQAHIEQQCQKGNLRYKNGRNLKDGLEVVEGKNLCIFNPIEVHHQLLTQKVSLLKQ
jgi:hypothetical protein